MTLNPNMTYLRQQLTSLVSLLYFRTGMIDTLIIENLTHAKKTTADTDSQDKIDTYLFIYIIFRTRRARLLRTLSHEPIDALLYI